MADRLKSGFAILNNMITAYHDTHHFWPDSVSLRDEDLFVPSAIAGHRQITDVYLLGLCQRMNGTLVTLDEKISLDAILNPRSDLVLKL